MGRIVIVLLVVGAMAGTAVFMLQNEGAEPRTEPGGSGDAGGPAALADPAGGTGRPGQARPAGSLPEDVQRALSALGVEKPQVPPGQALLTGRVVMRGEDAELVPVPGVTIQRHRIGSDGIADTAVEGEVTPNSEGWFLATVPSDCGWQLVARAPELASTTRVVEQSSLKGGAHDCGTLLMAAMAQVTVHVISGLEKIGEDTSPVAGLPLEVLDAEGQELASATTDKDGNAAFAGLPSGKVTFKGALEPYSSVEEEHTLSEGSQTIELNVQVVGQLKIRVRAPSGAVLQQFDLCVDLQHGTYQYVAPTFKSVEATEDGWYLVEEVKAAKHALYATAKGFALGTLENVEVKPGETTEVTVDLPPGFKVRGKVVAKKGGRPIANAIVYSETDLIPSSVRTDTKDQYRPQARATRTGKDGTFVLEDLTAGTHKLTGIHPDYASATNLSVTVGKDAPDESVRIELPVGSRLFGHAWKKDGSPDVGATIMVFNFLEGRALMKKPPLMTNADKDGAYEIKHVPPGFMMFIRQSQAEGRTNPDMKQHTFVDGQDVEHNFGEQGKGAIVKGVVTRKDGAPIKDRMVMLMSTVADGGMPLFYQAAIDPQGHYEITGVKGGSYIIALVLSNQGGAFAGNERITVPETGTVMRDIEASGGDLRGLVRSKDTGEPIADGEVALFQGQGDDPANYQFIGRADLVAGGKWYIPNVPEGTYILTVGAKNHQQKNLENITVRAGQVTEVPPVELAGGGRIVGRVLDKDGQGLPGAMIVLLDPQTGQPIPAWSFPTNPDGAFEATYVPKGSYGVTAAMAGRSFDTAQVTVTIGGAPRVTIREQP